MNRQPDACILDAEHLGRWHRTMQVSAHRLKSSRSRYLLVGPLPRLCLGQTLLVVAGNVGCISDVQCMGMVDCYCFSDTVSHERLIQSDSDRNDDG